MKRIRYLDMFAGVGGFRSGLTNAGDYFIPVGWCEIDKHAQKAYRALYETEGEYFCDDATQIKPEDLPEIDLICAGFPCQPFSVSGRRLGFADTRGTLFHEIVRVAEARRPAYLLLENVPGLLNHEGGKTFGTILAAIHELGYSLEWCVLNSANFGVPQQRRRVYIVGYLDSRLSGKIFPLTQSDGAPLRQVIPGGQGQRVYSPEGASTCLTSQGGGWGAKTGLYFVDMNPNPVVTSEARCITARYYDRRPRWKGGQMRHSHECLILHNHDKRTDCVIPQRRIHNRRYPLPVPPNLQTEDEIPARKRIHSVHRYG